MAKTANLQWNVPQHITSRFETLYLNENLVDGAGRVYRYQVLPDDFSVVPSLRVVQDTLSQQDGSHVYPRFKTGLVVTMTIRLQQQIGSAGEYTNACDELLVDMGERVARVLNSIRDLIYSDQQRYIWTPTGKANRMLANVVLLSWPDPNFEESETELTFQFETPFPYAVDEADTTTAAGDGVPVAIDNNGSANVWPVVKVYGPFTTFQLVNSDGLQLNYDGDRPGATGVGGSGAYAEIDFFRGTIFLNGNSTDLIPGVDPATSDFFALLGSPFASETFEVVGADADVIWAPAYS